MAARTHTTSSVGRVLVGLAVLLGIIGVAGAGSWADDSEHTRTTLRGLQGVYVIIEDLKPEVERAGLARQQLQTDAELRLRKAGIRAFTRDEALRVSGRPHLEVNVNVFLSPTLNGLASYAIIIRAVPF